MIKNLRTKSHPDLKFEVTKYAEMAGMTIKCSDCFFHLNAEVLL